MILGSPPWSGVSPEFTHGFPRKLLGKTSHGGFLRGNLTVTAKATNLCLRRLAVKDVAANISRQLVEGVGLSLARLLSCR